MRTVTMGRLGRASISRRSLSRKEEARGLENAWARLAQLRLTLGGQIGARELGPPVCVLFEGWDASGKGGAIKRLVAQIDPRHVRVVQFAAPTFDEKRHHFLWRFWPDLPGLGRDVDLRPLLVRPRAGRAGRGRSPSASSGCAPTTRSTRSSAASSTRG